MLNQTNASHLKKENQLRMCMPIQSMSKPKKSQLSQRDSYAKSMYGATKKGGSNGVGVGY
jgi:hypothetical protein